MMSAQGVVSQREEENVDSGRGSGPDRPVEPDEARAHGNDPDAVEGHKGGTGGAGGGGGGRWVVAEGLARVGPGSRTRHGRTATTRTPSRCTTAVREGPRVTGRGG